MYLVYFSTLPSLTHCFFLHSESSALCFWCSFFISSMYCSLHLSSACLRTRSTSRCRLLIALDTAVCLSSSKSFLSCMIIMWKNQILVGLRLKWQFKPRQLIMDYCQIAKSTCTKYRIRILNFLAMKASQNRQSEKYCKFSNFKSVKQKVSDSLDKNVQQRG